MLEQHKLPLTWLGNGTHTPISSNDCVPNMHCDLEEHLSSHTPPQPSFTAAPQPPYGSTCELLVQVGCGAAKEKAAEITS